MAALPSSTVNRFGRIAVAIYLLAWVVIIVGSWFYWDQMSLWLKALVVIVEVLFVPDIASIRDAFSSSSS